MVVLCIHSINGLLGYACLSWPSSLPSLSAGAIILLRTYTKTIMLVVRGLVTATGIALVEELLFRSWLPEEIAVDIGYYQAVVLSGIAFSLIHRYVSVLFSLFALKVHLFLKLQRQDLCNIDLLSLFRAKLILYYRTMAIRPLSHIFETQN